MRLECQAGPSLAPHQPVECKGPSPSLQAPAEGKDRRHSKTPRGWRPSWGGAGVDLATIQSIAPLYRWENGGHGRREVLGLPDRGKGISRSVNPGPPQNRARKGPLGVEAGPGSG